MMSTISSTFQKVNSLARRAIGKKTLIVIGLLNVAAVFHRIIRPEIRARRHGGWSAEANFLYEAEKNSLPK